MVRRIVFACLVAILILAGTASFASANPPVGTPPYPNPLTGHSRPVVSPAQPDKASNPLFKMVVNPVQKGWTTSDGTMIITLASFKNLLIGAVTDWDGGMRIITSKDGSHWTAVTPPGVFDPCYWFSYGFMEFRDHLYMTLHDWGSCGLPPLVIRTANGTDWEIVLKDTQGKMGASFPLKIGVFKGMIYLANNTNCCDPGQIWRSPSGDPGTWTQVDAAVGTQNYWFSTIVSFKGAAYLAGADWTEGPFILRSTDGLTWTKITDPLVNDPTNNMDTNLTVFKGQLYMSTNTWGPSGVHKIFRSKDGLKWELVANDIFGGSDPKTSVSNLFVYNSQLFAFAPDASGNTFIYTSGTGNKGSWTLLTPDGIGAGIWTEAQQQADFNGWLYFGTEFASSDKMGIYKMVNH